MDVVTQTGTVHAEHVVNAAGLWAREVGRMAGIHLPVQPMEHHYLITEDIPEIVEREERLPAGPTTKATCTSARTKRHVARHLRAPWPPPGPLTEPRLTSGHELLQPQLDNIAERLELGFERIPALAMPVQEYHQRSVHVRSRWQSDDGLSGHEKLLGGRRLVGRILPSVRCGSVHGRVDDLGEPSIDVWAMDIARFGDFATPDWGTTKSAENYERRSS